MQRPIKSSNRRQSQEEGMTLLEILIVMVILGLLATLGAIQIMGYLGKAKTDTAYLQVEELVTAVDLFKIDTGRVPTSEEGLRSLITPQSDLPKWRGPYLRKEDNLYDPWGRLWIYKAPGDHGDFDIVSYGADGKPGGEGDNKPITSWNDRKFDKAPLK